MSRMTEIPKDFSCPFVECAQFRYCATKICSRWEAWFNDTWSKIHKQGLDAIERRKLHERPQSNDPEDVQLWEKFMEVKQ